MEQPGNIPCLIDRERIAGRVQELGRQISADYAGKPLVLLGVLRGAWVFYADLVRALTIPVHCDFVMLSSYGQHTESSGSVQLLLDAQLPLAGKHVLIVEDIVDSGLAASWLKDHLRKSTPASVKLCSLLDKPSRRQHAVAIDYVGFTIEDHFVVGYGIDHAQDHRQLPYVGYLPE